MSVSSNYFAGGRRTFLLGFGSAAAGLAMTPAASLVRADEEGADHRFVSVYFGGAWDILLGPDARDPLSPPAGIDLGTSRLAPAYQTPIEVDVGGTPVLWGAAMAEVERHADALTLFRGVNMNTVAHPAGRAYVNTFIPPAGVVPKGDSLAVRMTSAVDIGPFVIPNVAIGIPSFNHSFGPEFTAVNLAAATETGRVLSALYPGLSPEMVALLRDAQDASGTCVGPDYPGRPSDDLAIAREQVRALLDGDYASEFDFSGDGDLLGRYGIVDPSNDRDPAVVAATAWKLLETGLATTVSVELPERFDTHGAEWATDQPARLQRSFDAVAALLDDLRSTDPGLTKTTVMVFSEFARTPTINGRGGRDHWFASSILVFGGGLKRGVFGSTVEDTLGLRAIDLVTGLPSDAGEVIRPEHVGATVAAAAGLDTAAFRVDPLDAWIGG